MGSIMFKGLITLAIMLIASLTVEAQDYPKNQMLMERVGSIIEIHEADYKEVNNSLAMGNHVISFYKTEVYDWLANKEAWYQSELERGYVKQKGTYCITYTGYNNVIQKVHFGKDQMTIGLNLPEMLRIMGISVSVTVE